MGAEGGWGASGAHDSSSWFEGLTIAHTNQGETILTGVVADQAALYGPLGTPRDLGLALISVSSVELRHQEPPACTDDGRG
jgi:hypothetical protein